MWPASPLLSPCMSSPLTPAKVQTNRNHKQASPTPHLADAHNQDRPPSLTCATTSIYAGDCAFAVPTKLWVQAEVFFSRFVPVVRVLCLPSHIFPLCIPCMLSPRSSPLSPLPLPHPPPPFPYLVPCTDAIRTGQDRKLLNASYRTRILLGPQALRGDVRHAWLRRYCKLCNRLVLSLLGRADFWYPFFPPLFNELILFF